VVRALAGQATLQRVALVRVQLGALAARLLVRVAAVLQALLLVQVARSPTRSMR
jgi:hypothetical protein